MSNSQSSIHKVANLLGYFRAELTTTFQDLGLTTTEETQAYVVHLLQGFARHDESGSDEIGFFKPAAFLLGEAMNSVGDRRIEAYRRLGDVSLFSCGFFGKHLARTPVSAGYYQSVGRIAYSRLGEIMEFKQPGGAFYVIFTELAHKFDAIVEALVHLSQPRGANQSPYEELLLRWQRSGELDSGTLMQLGMLANRRKAPGEDA